MQFKDVSFLFSVKVVALASFLLKGTVLLILDGWNHIYSFMLDVIESRLCI